MSKKKGVEIIGKAYMSGHNLVITIPKAVADELGIEPYDRIRIIINKVR